MLLGGTVEPDFTKTNAAVCAVDFL